MCVFLPHFPKCPSVPFSALWEKVFGIKIKVGKTVYYIPFLESQNSHKHFLGSEQFCSNETCLVLFKTEFPKVFKILVTPVNIFPSHVSCMLHILEKHGFKKSSADSFTLAHSFVDYEAEDVSPVLMNFQENSSRESGKVMIRQTRGSVW